MVFICIFGLPFNSKNKDNKYLFGIHLYFVCGRTGVFGFCQAKNVIRKTTKT